MASMISKDRDILRALAQQKAEIGRLPVQNERFQLWESLNALKARRPMVQIFQIPWHEMNVNDELTLQCQDPGLRGIETSLRQELYQWKHMPGDMIVEPVWYAGCVCGPVGSYADYGIREKQRTAEGGQNVGFEPVIHSEKDVEALRTPVVWVDKEKTDANYWFLRELFSGILEVKKRGIVHEWCAP